MGIYVNHMKYNINYMKLILEGDSLGKLKGEGNGST